MGYSSVKWNSKVKVSPAKREPSAPDQGSHGSGPMHSSRMRVEKHLAPAGGEMSRALERREMLHRVVIKSPRNGGHTCAAPHRIVIIPLAPITCSCARMIDNAPTTVLLCCAQQWFAVIDAPTTVCHSPL